MRQIALDTETTGLSPKSGHRLIEIGAVEIQNRRLTGKTFQVYLNPNRPVDPGAMAVHGITDEFLADKPPFSDILEAFLEFIGQSELIIHNAPFDLGFLNHELNLLDHPITPIETQFEVIDTLAMARKKHPGQRNSLDALCKRYQVSNTHRKLHGALLDAEILSELYLAMTAGQNSFLLEGPGADEILLDKTEMKIKKIKRPKNAHQLTVIQACSKEIEAHEDILRVFK